MSHTGKHARQSATQSKPSPPAQALDAPLRRQYNRIAVAVALFTLLLFAVTLSLRHPWYGLLTSWPTGSTLKFARYWYHEGPAHLDFAMLENPNSIEFPTLDSRNLYPTYPPGAVAPIYLLSVLRGREPDVALIMNYDLTNHLLIALLLGGTILLILYQLRFAPWSAFGLACVPVALELLLPGPLYWHQQEFFADHAVIFPFAAFVFLEVLGGMLVKPRARLLVDLAQSLVLFCGMFTDWLFLFVLLVALVKRLALGEFGAPARWTALLARALAFVAPACLALALYAIQIISLHGIQRILATALERMGAKAADPFAQQTDAMPHSFFGFTLPLNFGAPAVALIALAVLMLGAILLSALVRRVKRQPVSTPVAVLAGTLALLLLPCLLQVLVFKQHSARHAFAALKFSLPLATIPVLAPLLALAALGRLASLSRRVQAYGTLVVLLSTACWLGVTTPRYRSFFDGINVAAVREATRQTQYVRDTYGYDDVLFAYHEEIPDNPPQLLAISMKRVYRIASSMEAERFVAQLPGAHIVYLDQP